MIELTKEEEETRKRDTSERGELLLQSSHGTHPAEEEKSSDEGEKRIIPNRGTGMMNLDHPWWGHVGGCQLLNEGRQMALHLGGMDGPDGASVKLNHNLPSFDEPRAKMGFILQECREKDKESVDEPKEQMMCINDVGNEASGRGKIVIAAKGEITVDRSIKWVEVE